MCLLGYNSHSSSNHRMITFNKTPIEPPAAIKSSFTSPLPSRMSPAIMSSNETTTPNHLVESDNAKENLWYKISPVSGLAMMKGSETGTSGDPNNGKTLAMDKAREAGIASSCVTFPPLSQLRDIQGRSVVYGKRYLFREANRERDRRTRATRNAVRNELSIMPMLIRLSLTLLEQK